jgi:hypothetical protein
MARRSIAEDTPIHRIALELARIPEVSLAEGLGHRRHRELERLVGRPRRRRLACRCAVALCAVAAGFALCLLGG